MQAHSREYHGPINTEQVMLIRCAVGHIPSIRKMGEITTPIATIIARNTMRNVFILCFSILHSSCFSGFLPPKLRNEFPEKSDSYPFFGRSSITSSHSENTDSHRLHDPSGKILRNITLLPDIKALPFLPALSQKLHMQSLSLSHPHIVRTFQFHSCIRKERIPWKTPRRHALRSQSLRWHYPNQVRSKIYLPLSLSHKLPLALFFSVFQYSTPLFHCQTSLI